MDKVVQANAAGAEQSASASQELNLLAGRMKGSVSALAALAGGNGKNGNGRMAVISPYVASPQIIIAERE